MRISDWSSDVCSSDLGDGEEGDKGEAPVEHHPEDAAGQRDLQQRRDDVEGGEVQQELDALGAAVDGAAEAAGLALQVKAQGERVEVAESRQRGAAHRVLQDRKSTRLNSSH